MPGQTYNTNSNVTINRAYGGTDTGSISSTTTSSGYLQNTGYVPNYDVKIKYNRFVTISFIDPKRNNEEIYYYIVQSRGSTSDLDDALYTMLFKFDEKLLETSGGKEVDSIPMNNPYVKYLQQ